MNNWYALYTKPQCEKKVAASLTRKKVQNYCPVNMVAGRPNDKSRVLYQPLFPSYVFVQVEAQELKELKRMDGVINFAHWLGRPAVIRDSDIEMIRRFLIEHQTVELTKLPVNIDDKVKVVNGVLAGKESTVVELAPDKVQLLLPSLGYSMTATVGKSNVILFTSPRTHHLSPWKRVIS